MKKFSIEKTAEKITLLMLTIIMLRIPIAHYICIVKGLYYSYIAKTIYVCSVVCLSVVLFDLSVFRKKIKISPYEFLFSVMIVLLALSWHNALLPHKALYGESGRNEGLWMLLCYYLMFYASRFICDEKLRKMLMTVFIYIMAVHALYGLGQFYELTRLPFIHDYYHYAISGVAGNPNFMGSLMVMASAACIGMAVYGKKSYEKAGYVILAPVFIATLIFTKTMSAYVGLTMIIFIVFLTVAKHTLTEKGAKSLVTFITLITIFGIGLLFIVDKLTYGIISAEVAGVINQLKNGIHPETFASGRLLIWINIFKMLPQYLLFGVGIDGLQQPYFERYGLFFGTYLDKAHNELMHILITMGLPVLICYIMLYFFVLKDLKTKIKAQNNKTVNMALFMVIAGYLTQAMFNISVIDVAPYFWIILGLAARPIIENRIK